MKPKTTNLFPHSLDQEQTSQFVFQFFINKNDYTIKVYAKPTEENGKTGFEAKRKPFILSFPKSPNRQSVNKMLRNYGHLDGMKDHCAELLEGTNKQTLFAQCRALGQKSLYYKFCDAAITPSSNNTTIKIKIYDDVINLILPPDALSKEATKSSNIKLFHFILQGYEFDLDEMIFEPEMLNDSIKPAYLERIIKNEEESEKEPIKIEYSEKTIEISKKSYEATIIDESKRFILENKDHLSCLVEDKPETTIAQQLLDMMTRSELRPLIRNRVMMLEATLKKCNRILNDGKNDVSVLIYNQTLASNIRNYIKDLRSYQSYEEALTQETFDSRDTIYQTLASILKNNMNLLDEKASKIPFSDLADEVINLTLDDNSFLTTGEYKKAFMNAIESVNERLTNEEQTKST